MEYLLRMYATNVHNADTENEINMFLYKPNETPSLFTEELVAKTFCCADVHKEQYLNKIFTKGLEKFIRQSLRGYCPTQKTASVHDLDFNATSLLKP